jgi:putative flippase GtrA
MITLVSINLLVKGLNVYISKVIVTFIAQIVNFLCYKLLVFN